MQVGMVGLGRMGASTVRRLLKNGHECVVHDSQPTAVHNLAKDGATAASSNPDARLAIEMFCYSVRKQIAAMTAVQAGLDLLVFTGGIGENDAQVRAAICGGLSWVGISLDETRNRSAGDPISDASSHCPVRVLASQKDEQIARHTWDLVS